MYLNLLSIEKNCMLILLETHSFTIVYASIVIKGMLLSASYVYCPGQDAKLTLVIFVTFANLFLQDLKK